MDLHCQHSCDQQDKCLNNTSSMFLETTRIPYHHHHHHHDRCRLAGEGRHKAFLAKSLAQTLQSKSLTDRQTGKKTPHFLSFFRCRAKSESQQIRHDATGPRARYCASKTLCDTTHSFATRTMC